MHFYTLSSLIELSGNLPGLELLKIWYCPQLYTPSREKSLCFHVHSQEVILSIWLMKYKAKFSKSFAVIEIIMVKWCEVQI